MLSSTATSTRLLLRRCEIILDLKSSSTNLCLIGMKIVQARMWAQGLTVGILIVAGALHGAKRRNAVQTVDHSWQHIVSSDPFCVLNQPI